MQAPLQRTRLVPEVDGAMTLRITTISGKNQTTICVEGHLAVEEIENLQKEFQLAAAPVHLDLSGLGRQMPRVCGHSGPFLPKAQS